LDLKPEETFDKGRRDGPQAVNLVRTQVLRCVFLDAVLAARGALAEHLILDRRLLEERTATKLLQNASALVLLLEAAKCAIDRFMLLDDNPYHVSNPSFAFKISPIELLSKRTGAR
jgi:hypothetical protein